MTQPAAVTIAGVTDASFNGTFSVATQADPTHFTYLQTTADASSSGGTATPASAQVNYHGWLLGYDASILQQTSIFDVTPYRGALGGGIWQSGGGPSVDARGRSSRARGLEDATEDDPLWNARRRSAVVR